MGDSFFDLKENIPLDKAFNHDKYYCKCDEKNTRVDCTIDGNKDPPAVLVRWFKIWHMLGGNFCIYSWMDLSDLFSWEGITVCIVI